MILEGISITGMHKVTQKEYKFDSNLVYLVGPNGAGKSTVLEAIQLALLGYIPGYAKTNESIMKHCPGDVLSVKATLREGDQLVTLTRSWMRSGSSYKASTTVDPASFDISSKLSDIELPIFNFQEFRAMTANKLKEWFITFLPSTTTKVDWKKELVDSLGSRTALLEDSFLNDVLTRIEGLNLEGVDEVKAVNAMLKADQSFNKGQIARLQSTIESLIYYDDCDTIDIESLEAQKNELLLLKDQLSAWQSADALQQDIKRQIELLNLRAEDISHDTDYISLQKSSIDLQYEIEKLSEEHTKLQEAVRNYQIELAALPNFTTAVCPYTMQNCEDIQTVVEDVKDKKTQIQAKIDATSESFSALDAKMKQLKSVLNSNQQSMLQTEMKYSKLEALLQSTRDVASKPTEKTLEEINAEIQCIEQNLIKAAANAKYTQLTESLTSEKFKVENEQEILKIWIKLTDANGLQTSLMNEPFEAFECKMNQTISIILGENIKAKFNLDSKANSFSFGVVRDGHYNEFDVLSSGEQCLYTLAMLHTIITSSACDLKLLIIDDLLDHLDDSNMQRIIEVMQNLSDIQFVLAGVKKSQDSSICKEV